MNIAGAFQCIYPRSTTWKALFYLEKKSPVSFFFLKTCLDLSIFFPVLFFFFRSFCLP